MPTYRVTGPDGKSYNITAPDGATPEQALSNFKMAMGSKLPEAPIDPTEGMSTFDKLAAGGGKFLYDVGRGIGQKFGAVSQQEIDQARKSDEALMETGAGKAGNILGALAFTAPTMLIPGANTVTGAAATGAVLGGIMPTATGESTLRNIGEGAAFGAGGQVLGNLAGKAWRGAKSAAEPFTQGGQDAILGRLLEKTSGGGTFAQDAANKLRTAKELVPGSLPTAGQAAGNPGIAALERTATATQPEVAAELAQRLANQNQARASALGDLADPSKLEFFNQSRQAAAKDLYAKAFAEAPAESPWIKGQFTNLKMRPAFKAAVEDAQVRALNEGIKLDPKNTTQVAHYTKMALDDAIGKAKASGSNAEGLIATRDKLVSVMESKDFAPSYREARDTYKQMSGPINEIQTAQAIEKAAVNPLTGQVQPQAFARAMSDQTAQRATKFNGATLENTMTPEALQTLKNIQEDLLRSQFAQNAGRGPGSDTIQKLAYSNMIDAAGVPGWIRNMGAGQLVGNLATRGADAVYGRANKELSTKLAGAMLNPQEVARLMSLPQLARPEYAWLRNSLGLLGANTPAITQPGLLP